MEIDNIDNVTISDVKGLLNNQSEFSLKNKKIYISNLVKIEKIKSILEDRIKENKDINFFVEEEKQNISYELLAFYND
jgi:hypothetical protein|nr:MAG TPA: hypothetical protein [Caudoviricetes sp.]